MLYAVHRGEASSSLSLSMDPKRYLVPGLIVLAAVGLGALTLSTLKRPAAPPSETAAPSVRRVGAGAFGPLAAQPSGARAEAGLGAGATSAPAPAVPPQAGGDAAQTDKSMLVPPDFTPTIYKHVYKGGTIEGLAAQIDVYRRERGSLAPMAGVSGLGLMDLGRLREAGLQSYTIAEDRENGYVVAVNPEEGTVNIYENYPRWSYPERACADEACFEAFRLKESDMIADEEAIRIAEVFLAGYGVSKDGYGAPTVRDDWRVQFARTTDKASFWFPEIVTVVYPQIVDGKPVYDEGGAPHGLNVNVNVRHKRAAGLWNLATRNFLVSSYAGETDAARLIAVAEKGGLYGDQWMPEGATVVEVELGTPTLAFSRVWHWDGTQGAELIVPTLVFPVINAPAEYWRTNVTVPLAKDLLQTPVGGGPEIMPLERAVQ